MTHETDYWFDLGPIQAIPKRGARTVSLPRREIAVFRTANDEVFALENRCPHKGGPLSDGIVHGRKVACPLHNWIIDLESGAATGADQGCARSFPIKVENDRVFIDMGVAAAP
ncbi:nitrite reductase small subunit NirD [Elstera cyanobacteriorum]|uniref:Nitrite reductase (NAD(P)H) small subunit n=1 Tax=Elstera cyanobacteriorum TaxID=2022747 RepID=A0A255XS47_9PROT|nr:nitrite reductase small subunit NirD [Elstera cyanobacteriorum]MCK6444704.1 nitrite reductase small subunit NirD [Elstera cyanobacteriorum]OYQ19255.1 nitrite reductase (NAD(P)H) small subunit [Elstera cyanobacteriorum]GFZ90124.1 tRNA-(guanine-N1)-methyltransferase [Elstera cyanobacteriorum]